jgi:hypothetical protein
MDVVPFLFEDPVAIIASLSDRVRKPYSHCSGDSRHKEIIRKVGIPSQGKWALSQFLLF